MEIAAGAEGGNVALGIVVLIVLIGLCLGYNTFKTRGFRPRRVETSLSAQQLRGIFAEKVAGHGWSIVDDGNPMVAQSALLAGIRQQIALNVVENNGRSVANLAVTRYSKKVLGGATKAYTLRWRMNAFLSHVQRLDASASVAG
ncbi:hypothetical protein [Amycolatopsis circi]|uniref:hypothetical protein n=1 Tax=Amycolatopsis circi TaxID=871959 RepID=UPI000E25171F|nr:hypothetical protein [Amycolatopsis circi]